MKVGIIGEGRLGIGSALLRLLSIGGYPAPLLANRSGPSRKRITARYDSYLYRHEPLTTDARHWHIPADPLQSARIEAAAVKRERKSQQLFNWGVRHMSGPSLHPTRSNIFYITK